MSIIYQCTAKIIDKYYNNNLSFVLLFSNFMNINSDISLLKYSIFKRHILYNFKLDVDTTYKATCIFSLYQQLLFSIIKLQKIFRFKRYKVFDVDTDINLQPLSKLKDTEKICLIEQNTIYEFSLYDLLKIINNALLSNEYIRPTPQHPRNPYTNLTFSYHNIINILLALKNNSVTFNLKAHIISYYEKNLNLNTFFEYNSFLLKISAIQNYLKTETDSALFNYICDMFEDYKQFTSIIIDSGLKKKKAIVDKTRYLLFYYFLLQQYTVDDIIHIKYEAILIQELKQFEKLHPRFGRRIAYVSYRHRRHRSIASFIARSPSNIQNVVFPSNLINTYENDNVSNNAITDTTDVINNGDDVSNNGDDVNQDTNENIGENDISSNINIAFNMLLNNPPVLNLPELDISSISTINAFNSIPSLEEWVNNNCSVEEENNEGDNEGDNSNNIINNNSIITNDMYDEIDSLASTIDTLSTSNSDL